MTCSNQSIYACQYDATATLQHVDYSGTCTIERRRCEHDRRLVYVAISSKGLKLLEAIKIDELQLEMDAITEEEAKTLNEILDKIR